VGISETHTKPFDLSESILPLVMRGRAAEE
jgi:hypothetical protein